MAQGLYQHVRQTWKRPNDALPHMYRQTRMAQWRREPVNCRIERPTRLDAARSLGYKAKQGVVVIRTRIRRGGLRKGKIHMKRKPSKAGIKKITMAKNTQRMAEERVARHFPNLEVLNSYWVGQDEWCSIVAGAFAVPSPLVLCKKWALAMRFHSGADGVEFWQKAFPSSHKMSRSSPQQYAF